MPNVVFLIRFIVFSNHIAIYHVLCRSLLTLSVKNFHIWFCKTLINKMQYILYVSRCETELFYKWIYNANETKEIKIKSNVLQLQLFPLNNCQNQKTRRSFGFADNKHPPDFFKMWLTQCCEFYTECIFSQLTLQSLFPLVQVEKLVHRRVTGVGHYTLVELK